MLKESAVNSEGGRVNTIIRTCRLLDRMSRGNPDEPRSHSVYYRILADYYTRIVKAKEEGRFIAAHTVWFPAEILYAMDIVPMHTEITAWMTALFSGHYTDLLSAAAEVGIAPETCSPYRVLTGALASHAIPRPNVVLSSSLICDNNAKIGDVIMHLVKSPGFFLDYPFQRTGLETDYLKNELMEMIHFLEKESGQKMDWHKLKEGIARLDKQIETAREIQKLRRNTPSPFIPMDFLKMFTADCLYPGEAEATEYIETLHSELAEKVKAGKGIGYPEKFRILSIGIPPILLQRAVEQTLSEHGAVSVTDPYSCTWEEGRLDADDPLENVIHKIRMLPSSMFYGPLTDRVAEKVVQDAQTYKVDGAIFYAHIGCRQSSAMIKLIKEALNSIDIPILVLDCDIVDITVTPEEDLCHKLQQFFELLEDR